MPRDEVGEAANPGMQVSKEREVLQTNCVYRYTQIMY